MTSPRPVPDVSRLQQFQESLEPLAVKGACPESLAYYLDAYGIHFQQEPFFSGLSYHCGYLQVDGLRLFCQLWKAATCIQGTVFILHGYYDHSALYRHVIHFFLELGYAVFAFDQPGHGLSGGAAASIDCFSRYTAALKTALNWATENNLPRPFHLFGQSMGGAIITELLVGEGCGQQQYPFGHVILFAPLIRPVMWRWGRVQYWLARRFVKQLPRSRSRNSNDPVFLEFLHNEPLQHKKLPVDWVGAMERWIEKIEKKSRAKHGKAAMPCPYDVLIVQGRKDGTVDWQHNIPVYQTLYRSVDVHYIPEGQHHLANEREDIRQDYLQWLAKKLNEQPFAPEVLQTHGK